MKTVTLKDDRTVLVGRFETDDKERLFQMYESLSDETVRWALSRARGWFSGLQNVIAIVALHDDKSLGMSKS